MTAHVSSDSSLSQSYMQGSVYGSAIASVFNGIASYFNYSAQRTQLDMQYKLTKKENRHQREMIEFDVADKMADATHQETKMAQGLKNQRAVQAAEIKLAKAKVREGIANARIKDKKNTSHASAPNPAALRQIMRSRGQYSYGRPV